MAQILTTQAELDAIFSRMERDYGALSKRQEAFAIREIGRVRGEVSDMLTEFADSDGIIKRRRAGMVLSELDDIEALIREHGTLALNSIIEESSEWTVNAINKGVGISTGTRAVNRHVVNYVSKRFGEDGLVLSDRIWGLSGEIRDELSTVIRTNIIKGEGINAMIPQIRRVYDNETWKIRRLARTESVTAHRATIGYNARESGVVEWVQFHHGIKSSEPCVDLANEDRYGKGPGVFKPMDTDIWQPHVQCTGYSTYILDERWL